MSCERVCLKSRSNILDPAKRAALGCGLPGWDLRRNTNEKLVRIRKWMGAPPDHTTGDERPVERLDYCPQSWQRSGFAVSVLQYARRRTRDGGRVPNRFYDLNTDELVIEAVRELESYDDWWHAEREDAVMAQEH